LLRSRPPFSIQTNEPGYLCAGCICFGKNGLGQFSHHVFIRRCYMDSLNGMETFCSFCIRKAGGRLRPKSAIIAGWRHVCSA
jgi:hypothetical protein